MEAQGTSTITEPEAPAGEHLILVVDDDDGVRETVVELLEMTGHKCLAAPNVAEALKLLSSESIDLVITDMHMPGQSGLDLIDQVQKLDDSIPVILITGFPSVNSAISALKRGAIEFISKPFNLESISRIVEKALRERGMRLEIRRLQAESHKAEVIAKLNRELNARVEELTRLYSISEAMTQFMDTGAIFEQIVRLASEVTGAQRVSLMVLDRSRRHLKIRASIGVPSEVIGQTRVRVGQGISGKVLNDGSLVRATRQVHQSFSGNAGSLGLGLYASQSWLSAPLTIAGRNFGVLNLTDKPDRSDFSLEEEQLVLALVEKAGVKLENQALYEGIYANLVDTLNSLVTTIEAKDPYTREHSHRVTEYSLRIAERLELSEDQREFIDFAAVLHDIGKIGVRDEILTKGGGLTDDEYEAIKEHVTIGEKIVAPLGLSEDERSIIRNHHEKFDGSGYPDGLKGEEIPYLARVVAVADAFDAMTSTRPYRNALSTEEATAEIESKRGSQFDPEISAAAVEIIREGKFDLSRFPREASTESTSGEFAPPK